MNIEKLKAVSEAVVNAKEAGEAIAAGFDFMEEMNPVNALALIAEVEALRAERDQLLQQVNYFRTKSRGHFDAATGAIEELEAVTQQRDELLAALKAARNLVAEWGSLYSAYFQDVNDLVDDLKRLDDFIAKAEAGK